MTTKKHIDTALQIHFADTFELTLLATTNADHFAQLQALAADKGYVLTPDAMHKARGKKVISTEAQVYSSLSIPFIPPEMRTDHSPTAHYAHGLCIDRLKEQWEEIDRVQQLVDIKIFKGTELDILADGRLDYPDHILEKFDIIIASIHSRYHQDYKAMTRRVLRGLQNPFFKIWGHPLGRLVLRRDPIPVDLEEILEAVKDQKIALEISADPYRLDLSSANITLVRKKGFRFVISVDAHSTNDLHNLEYGIHQARRAGVQRDEVINTLAAGAFAKNVRPR